MSYGPDVLPRSVLPIPDRAHSGRITYDAKDPTTSFPKITPLRPPTGAPNVLIVLLDDVGFAASSPFGGPINTPTAARLAAGGLKATATTRQSPGTEPGISRLSRTAR
jgi:arylsulfatase